MSKRLLRSKMYRDLVLGCTGDSLLETLFKLACHLVYHRHTRDKKKRLTSFSNTQLFNCISGFRHSHIWWLLFSRHSQCELNCFKQWVLISLILHS